MKTIYAIRDRIAKDLVGNFTQLVCFRTDSQAVRYFGDSAAMQGSAIGAHLNDYELIKIADVDDEGNILTEHGPSIVITGSAIVAMQADTKPELVKEP